MRKFDKEFKKEVVKRCLDGQSVASISREIRFTSGKRDLTTSNQDEFEARDLYLLLDGEGDWMQVKETKKKLGKMA